MKVLIPKTNLHLEQLIQHNLSQIFIKLKSISMEETFDKRSNRM